MKPKIIIFMLLPASFQRTPRIQRECLALNSLAKEGVLVNVLDIGQDSEKESVYSDMNCRVKHFGIPFRKTHFLSKTLVYLTYSIRAFVSILRMRNKETRASKFIIHCHHLHVLLVGILLKKIVKAILIYDAYEFYPLYFQRYTPHLASFFYSLERQLAKSSDLLVTWYPTIAAFVRKRYGVKKVIVFPNLPPPWFHNLEASNFLEERKSLGIDEKDFVILYAGALLPEYMLTELLEACDLLIRKKGMPKIKVLIAAREAHGSLDLRKKIKELSLEAHCIFVGFRPYRQVPHLYQLSDLVYAMYKPEKDHLFLASGKIFEAMVSKKPVLTCDKGEKKRIVEEARCGFALRPTAEEIAEAIQFLSKNRSKAIEMGSNGHLYFSRQFSWKKVTNRLRSAYLALVESKC